MVSHMLSYTCCIRIRWFVILWCCRLAFCTPFTSIQPKVCLWFWPNLWYCPEVAIQTTPVTPNMPLCLEGGISLTTAALKSTDTKVHQNISVSTFATTNNLTLNQIGDESIAPPQPLSEKSTLPYLNRNVNNTYNKRALVYTQDKSHMNPPNHQQSFMNTSKKKKGSITFAESVQRKMHQSSATNVSITKTTADTLIWSLTQVCPFCKSKDCLGQYCWKKSHCCYYSTLDHYTSKCETKYNLICWNCRKESPNTRMKKDGKVCCAVMAPIMVDKLFKEMSDFVNPRRVCVQCFDPFGQGFK